MRKGWRGTLGELGAAAMGVFWAEAVQYARQEIGAYARWRGSDEPVLADGYDAEGLAQAAFARLLAKEAGHSPASYTAEEIRHELRSGIKHRVRWLHERHETRRVRSEWDVLPRGEEGEPVSIFNYLPGQIAAPDDELLQKEKAEWLGEFKARFEATLGGREDLREVFRRSWEGQKRREIAREMGEDVARVKALQAQIKRRGKEEGRMKNEE